MKVVLTEGCVCDNLTIDGIEIGNLSQEEKEVV